MLPTAFLYVLLTFKVNVVLNYCQQTLLAAEISSLS